MASITGTNSSDSLDGTAKADIIHGLDGNDTLNGGGGNDILVGGFGSDVLNGGKGADRYVYDDRHFGNDVITGFDKADKIDLSALHVGDFASLAPFLANEDGDVVLTLGYGGYSESIRIDDLSVADLKATNFVFDTAKAGIRVEGTDFDDVLFGGLGGDTLIGGDAGDALNGGAGKDRLYGGGGGDNLRGGSGNDVFVYDARYFGTDVIWDFGAKDKIDLSALNVGDLATLLPFAQNDDGNVVIHLGFGGYAESITIANMSVADLTSSMFAFNKATAGLAVEGTNFGDVLFGGNGDDTLRGYGSSDHLSGGQGDDRLIGGTSSDYLGGGKGADTFVYDNTDVSSVFRDELLDFSHAEHDKIDLSAIDADVTKGGDQAFALVAGSSFTAPGQIVIVAEDGIYHLYFNTDADSSAEMEMFVTSSTSLVASDFSL